MPTLTTNYSLFKPLVNNATDQDLWGGYLNDDMDDIDTLLRSGITIAVQASQTSGFTADASISVKKLYPCNATGGAIAVTIPTAASVANGATVFFKKTDSSANAVTLSRSSSDTLDGATSIVLSVQNEVCGLVSDGTSKWYAFSFSISAASKIVIQNFTSTGTYTPTTGMLYCDIQVFGGGGGGGGVSNVAASVTAAGGGSGGYSRGVFSASTIGASQTVTIGAGGTAGANTGGTGGTGGTTSVGSLIQATGGTGGIGATTANVAVQGGAGGVGSLGSINAVGVAGGNSTTSPGTGTGQNSGSGGPTMLGGNGAGITNASSNGGSAANNSGSGGSGAASGAGGTGRTGGVGGSGFVTITEYCAQ